MSKKRLALNRTKGYKNYNSPIQGPYSSMPVHYKMIEDIHADMDSMDDEILLASKSTFYDIRQIAHGFTTLTPIYYDITSSTWELAKADDSDTISTHVVVEVIDSNNFVAGLYGLFTVTNELSPGYYFTSDSEAGALVNTAPDINNPVIQVINSNTIRVLDIGVIIDGLEDLTISTPFTPVDEIIAVGDTIQESFQKTQGQINSLDTSKVDKDDELLTNRNNGFVNSDVVDISYVNRKVTITGTNIEATYEGEKLSDLVTGWESGYESEAHADTTDTYYLTYNGTSVAWRTTFNFTDVLIAIKPENSPFCLRECHGRNMAEDTHRNNHFGIGALLYSGGAINNLVIDSFTAGDRRPYVAQTLLLDEDLKGTLPALNTNSYTRAYISGEDTLNYLIEQADIVEVGVDNRPYYYAYNPSTGEYDKTLIPYITTGDVNARDRYMSVYMVGIPVTSDTTSQKYRFIFVQGQGFSTTLNGERNKDPRELYLGEFQINSPEYSIFQQFIIRYDVSEEDWNIADVQDIRGTQYNPVSIINTGVTPQVESPFEPKTEDIAVGDRLQEVAEKAQGQIDELKHDAVDFSASFEINSTNIATYNGKYLRCTAAGDVTITIAEGAGITLQIAVNQIGAGQVTIAGGGAVVLNGEVKTSDQYFALAITLSGTTDTYDIIGGIA